MLPSRQQGNKQQIREKSSNSRYNLVWDKVLPPEIGSKEGSVLAETAEYNVSGLQSTRETAGDCYICIHDAGIELHILALDAPSRVKVMLKDSIADLSAEDLYEITAPDS